MNTPKLIEPRLETPVSKASSGTPHALPQTLLSEQIERLAICAIVGAGLWSYGLVMDTIVRPATLGVPASTISMAVEVVAILGSLALFGYVRYASNVLDRKTE